MYYRLGTGVGCGIGAHADRGFVFIYQAAALFCVKWRHGRRLEIMTSNRKSDSVNRCVFTWSKLLPNFIVIRFENDGAPPYVLSFFEEVAPTRTLDKS